MRGETKRILKLAEGLERRTYFPTVSGTEASRYAADMLSVIALVEAAEDQLAVKDAELAGMREALRAAQQAIGAMKPHYIKNRARYGNLLNVVNGAQEKLRFALATKPRSRND